jgi:acetyl esterase/lipase
MPVCANAIRPERAVFAAVLLGLCAPVPGDAQSPSVLLWPAGAPGSEGNSSAETVRLNDLGEHIVSHIHFPSITPYLPAHDAATGAAVIVVPGGGHAELWMDHEGYRVAQFLADHGVAAFVLKYRLAREKGSTYTVEGNALPDLQRAIRLVRDRAGAWQLDPHRIGVMGFSAGGELAALASVHFDGGQPGAASSVERHSARPDFQVLLYPSIPHGVAPSGQSPPAFLLCGADDQPAISQGLAELYLSLRRVGVSAELHIYAGVGHGFGLRPGNIGPAAAWPQQVLDWLDVQGLTKPR